MRRAPVRIRAFILGTVLALMVVPLLAGVAASQVDQQHQRTVRRHHLDAAFAYVNAHRTHLGDPGRRQAFAALLDHLDLLARVSLIDKIPRRKTLLYVSPALQTTTPQQDAQRRRKETAAGRGKALPAAPATSAATRDRMTERVIRVATPQSIGGIVADIYQPPASRASEAITGLLTGIAVLVVGLAVVLWLAGRWMVTPLRQLSAQVDKVAGGDLEIAIPRSRIDEIANIAQAVGGMTTALVETAERRAEADEARRFLFTSIAHDLRTPLFALRGHLQAVRSGLGDPTQHLERAEARADALERLVGNLFAFTRDDYARPALRLEAVAVTELLEDAVAGLEHAARLRGATFALDGDPTIDVMVDRDRVKRALVNILDNALRYSPAGEPIQLSWSTRERSTVVITIRDHGPGIDDALLPYVFEPGIRGTPQVASTDDGAGLGLAIARRLLEQQDATITAHNVPTGGAVLNVSLDRAESSHAPARSGGV